MGVRSTRGFTLLELLVVMTIMALVIGVATVSFSGSNPSVKLKAESRQLISNFRYARSRALSESRIFSVSIIDDGRGYQVDPGAESILLPPTMLMSLHSQTQGPELSSDRISFYPDGSSSGGTITLSVLEGDVDLKIGIAINWITSEISHASG